MIKPAKKIKFPGKRKFLQNMRKEHNKPDMTFNEAIDLIERAIKPQLIFKI